MPRRAQPPRLWLRPARHDSSGRLTHGEAWFILDKGRQIGTAASNPDDAELALSRYLTAKRHTLIATKKRDTDEIPIADVINIYATDVAPKVSQPHRVAERLKRLLKFFHDKTLADMNGKLCRDYAKQSSTDTMARRDLEDLRAAINYHRREGLHDRMVSVVLPAPRPPREKWLDRGEVAKLLWELWCRGQSKHVARFVLVALYTGRRASVVCSASFEREAGRTWVDVRAGFLRPPERVKQTKKRNPPIPLPPRLLAHLKRWQRGGARYVVEYSGKPVSRVDKVLKHAARDIGIGYVTPHVLRHTAATWQMQAGTDLFEAGRYLGMSVHTLTNVYAHHRPEHLTGARDAYDRTRLHQRFTNDTREPNATEKGT